MELQQTLEDPIQRTSTPDLGESSNHSTDFTRVEDLYYSTFCSRLEAPLTKVSIRGIYGPKKNIINGHFAEKRAVPPQNKSYTYVMWFSQEYSSRYLDCSGHDTHKHNSVQCYRQFSPIIYANHYYYYAYARQPIAPQVQQLAPMYFLPVKYR